MRSLYTSLCLFLLFSCRTFVMHVSFIVASRVRLPHFDSIFSSDTIRFFMNLSGRCWQRPAFPLFPISMACWMLIYEHFLCLLNCVVWTGICLILLVSPSTPSPSPFPELVGSVVLWPSVTVDRVTTAVSLTHLDRLLWILCVRPRLLYCFLAASFFFLRDTYTLCSDCPFTYSLTLPADHV